MNVFEKFGMYHLSPSSIDRFVTQPAYWALTYLKGFRDEAGPAASRGHAVQFGVQAFMLGDWQNAGAHGRRKFAELTDGRADDAHEKERALIEPIINQVNPLVHGRPMPICEKKVEVYVEGLQVPIIGFIDWLWPDELWDLKTKKSMPSVPPISNIRQMALYSHATKLPATLLYATAKKTMLYKVTPGEVESGMKFISMVARTIQKVLERCETADEVCSLYAPDYDSFVWSELSIDKAKEIWKE